MSFNIKLVYLLVLAIVLLSGGGLAGYFLKPNGVAQETYQQTLNQVEILTTNSTASRGLSARRQHRKSPGFPPYARASPHR